mgnify:CR=1 FL=1
MLKSMTAFGRRETSGDWGQLIWELRAVNHRYLEIAPRLADELRALEPALRERVGKRLKRGKIECVLRFRPQQAAASELQIDQPLAEAVIQAAQNLGQKMRVHAHASPLDILAWPGVVSEPERDLGPIREAALTLLEETLDDLIANREREGAQIAHLLTERCDAIAAIVAAQREHRPSVLLRLREKWQARLDELSAEIDPQRLEQELAFAAQKLDVDEELDRLDAHVAEARSVLERREPVGRRLDFLMQELNREANTLGSKSADIDTTNASVELKVLIEQMREQVQNIE